MPSHILQTVYFEVQPDLYSPAAKTKMSYTTYNDPVWFEPRHVERFMKFMTADIELNDLFYTNPCIRSTVLNEVGGKFEARHVCALRGHKNESSIRQYAVKCPENKKKEMFDNLSNLMEPKDNLEAQPQTSNQTINNVPTFDIEPVDFETKNDRALIDYLDQNEQLLSQMVNETKKENAVILAQNKTQNVSKQVQPRPKTNNNQINNVQN